MADPVTWGVILTATSAAAGAISSVRQGQASNNAAAYNAQIAEQNQQVAAAQSAAASGVQQRDTELKMGAAMAAYGASGVQAGNGSPTDVLAASARNATLNNLALKYNYQLQGLGYQNQAALDSAQASNSSAAGAVGAAGALLGGATKIASPWGGGGTAVPKFGSDVTDSNPQVFT